MSWSDESEAHGAASVARAVANVVGDGCVVFVAHGRGRRLYPAAVAHRDRERQELLELLLEEKPRALRDGWAGQALAKNMSFRLRHMEAAEAVSPAHGADLGVTAAALAPLRAGGAPAGVVVALRDSCDFAYSADEQRRVEQLAAAAPTEGVLRGADRRAGAARSGRALEQAPAGVWVTDPGGMTTYVNHAACALAGVPEAVLIGEPMADFLDGEAKASPLAATADRRDQVLTRADGREVWVSVASAPLSDVDGLGEGWIHTIIEVGERRAVEVAARLRASSYEAVADFAEVAFAGEDFGVLAQEAVVIAADSLGADYVALAEVGPRRTICTPRALHGWPRELLGTSVPLHERSPANLCLDEDRPVVVRDFAALEHLERSGPADQIAARSCMCVSVGNGVGVLSAHSMTPGGFEGQDLSFLSLLTAALGARWQPAANDAPYAASAAAR
jgi:PAS domain S-box-containing protein